MPEAATGLVVVTQGPRPQVLPRMPWIALEDSAADEQALQALHELEFRSLGKDHVRGVVPSVGLHDPTRGGTASGPVSSLNIEEFAGHDRVKYYVDFFLEPSRARFTIWLGRLARYDGMIRNVLQRYNLPEDLIYLALIESGYSNTAVSRASAIGMWQFIRSTGREYGLRIDRWVDERRDPFKATDAAARHLSDLQKEFNSWYLAAAAYNGGASRVSRGLRRLNEDAVSDSTFFVLAEKRWIRRETRDYVPKLIAATMVAKDPVRYGFDSIPALEPLVFDEITVADQTGLDVIASLADTTIRAIRELNPQYYRGATPPGEQVTVRVPRGSGNRVAQEYAQLPPSERVNFLEHRVRRGETMGEIAQRYGVGLSSLQAANPRVRPRRMRIGQRLIIPMSRSARSRRARPVARAAVPPSGRHTVRWGDTLWIVSQRYGVTLAELRRWNDMPPTASDIKVGQRLRVRR
ncbi:MAG: LysM peptidoglycan-binding domain-containing protein [Nitrospira sp.]|nr:LysM peptidoglycan-binding domain-containing protein [Nitrospira sp.]